MSAPTLYRLPRSNGNTAAGIYAGAVLTVVSVIGVAMWAATQYAAYRLRFHPALGAPLVAVPPEYRAMLGASAVIVGVLAAGCLASRPWRHAGAPLLGAAALVLALSTGPLYAPVKFFVWWWRFGHVAGTEPVWRAGMWAVSVPSHLAVFIAIGLAVRRARKLSGPTDTHGSARWAVRKDLKAAGLIGRDAGVYIGAWADGRRVRCRRPAR